jgi:hypothetical protein
MLAVTLAAVIITAVMLRRSRARTGSGDAAAVAVHVLP